MVSEDRRSTVLYELQCCGCGATSLAPDPTPGESRSCGCPTQQPVVVVALHAGSRRTVAWRSLSRRGRACPWLGSCCSE